MPEDISEIKPEVREDTPLSGAGKGIELVSLNGTRFLVTVSDTGTLVTTEVV